MKFTITEMSVGEILERGVTLFFRRLPTFFAIQFLVVLPTLVLQLALPDLGVGPFANLFLFPTIILGPIGSAAMLRVIAQEYLEQPIGLGEAFRFALGRFLPLLGTTILAGLGILGGFLFCCIPGIYLAVIWAFISQVIVMENIAGPSAMARSKSLVEGYFWHVFGVLLLLGLCVGAVNVAVEMGLALGLPHAEVIPAQPLAIPVVRLTSYLNYAILHVVSALVNAFGQTFLPICTTLLYFDLRNRKEAFDVGHIVAWLDQYRDWRDEPTTVVPVTGPAGSPETGIKQTGDVVPPFPPPETGFQDPKAPRPGDGPPPQ